MESDEVRRLEEEAVKRWEPGGEYYVRRLRDQAAVAFRAAYLASPIGGEFTYDEVVEEANRQIRALGYAVPEAAS